MKLIKISVFVDVEDHVTQERVLNWIDEALTSEWNKHTPIEGFETFQTGIESVQLIDYVRREH